MLTPYSHSKFITKTLTSIHGGEFRVVFLVSFVNGKMKAEVVSATPLPQSFAKPTVACLPSPIIKNEVSFTYTPAFSSIISPYTSFFFYTSQPTRAPAVVK